MAEITRLTADSFVDLRKAEKIKITPNSAAHKAFLADAGHADPSVLRAVPAWKERSAALHWAQNSLARAEDPALWNTALNPALLPELLSLYALPPYHGPAPPPPDTVRLATQITAFQSQGGPGRRPAAATPRRRGSSGGRCGCLCRRRRRRHRRTSSSSSSGHWRTRRRARAGRPLPFTRHQHYPNPRRRNTVHPGCRFLRCLGLRQRLHWLRPRRRTGSLQPSQAPTVHDKRFNHHRLHVALGPGPPR
jgi:hypothetical protein